MTLTYLSAVLGQQERSVVQVLRNLRTLGLIDEDGKPTELANDWRDDNHYPAACRVMLERVYPEELLQIAPPPQPDREAVKNWFMRARKMGSGAASNLTATYLLLARGEPTGERPVRGSRATATGGSETTARSTSTRGTQERPSPRTKLRDAATPAIAPPIPQIAVQVNIDPAMTPEQIEAVFASMARHLYQIAE